MGLEATARRAGRAEISEPNAWGPGSATRRRGRTKSPRPTDSWDPCHSALSALFGRGIDRVFPRLRFRDPRIQDTLEARSIDRSYLLPYNFPSIPFEPAEDQIEKLYGPHLITVDLPKLLISIISFPFFSPCRRSLLRPLSLAPPPKIFSRAMGRPPLRWARLARSSALLPPCGWAPGG